MMDQPDDWRSMDDAMVTQDDPIYPGLKTTPICASMVNVGDEIAAYCYSHTVAHVVTCDDEPPYRPQCPRVLEVEREIIEGRAYVRVLLKREPEYGFRVAPLDWVYIRARPTHGGA